MSWVPPPPPKSPDFYIRSRSSGDDFLSIVDNNGKSILCITAKGKVIWEREDKADEAAQLFVDAIQKGIEIKAGIKQNRAEWEERMLDTMKKHAEIEPLTADVLEDVFKKAIMIDKLKGIK